MKIPAILTCLLAAVLSALPLSQARADDVSFDVFYNSLSDQGDWYNTPDYGYVWQPSIAYQNDKWRPYTDGYWAQTDDGWTWVSYENFGWATYHYGRWTNLQGTGWVWVPGYDWGPGWVSWRTSNDYVGWAPLPPRRDNGGGSGEVATVDYNTVEPADGYNASVDEQYDIGPTNYCFVETRYFGAPVLREVILPPQRNIFICENTINVTDITYRHDGPRVVVFNGGPDYAFISGRVDRPIQRLRIEPNNGLDFAHGFRDHNPNVVRDGVFRIAAPTIAPRPVNFAQVRPPTVKRDIRDPRIEHGWSNTGADPAAVQRLRQQFQQQAREVPARPPGGNPAAAGFNPAGRPPGNAPGGFTPPGNRDARANTPPAPPVNPAANQPPRGNTDADRSARRDAAEHEKDERDAARNNNNEGGFKPPTAPAGQPANPARHVPNPQETAHEPATAPAPAREANQNREDRPHTPEANPRADVSHEDRHPTRPPEPSNNNAEEARHAPRQPEQPHAQPPARNTESEERHPQPPSRNSEPEERPARPQEQPHAQPPQREARQEPAHEARQEPPHEARQEPPHEVRENRPATQPAPPPQRAEAHESRPQPNANDDKKKPNGP